MTWSTREDAIKAVSECTSFEALFDVANRALGSARQAWGDDLKTSAELAYLWSTAAFPVQAREQVAVLDKEGETIDGIDGSRFVDAGFSAAKAIAIQMLAPHVNGPIEGAVVNVLNPIAKDLGGGDDAGMGGVHMLAGAQFSIHVFAVNTRKMAGYLIAETWEDIDHHLTPPKIGARSSVSEMNALIEYMDNLPKASDDVFSDMIKQAGFSYVRCGPSGGMAQCRQAALAVLHASRALADHLKIPQEKVGLDDFYCAINSLGGSSFASCDRTGKGIIMGRPPGYFGHEWTHAMEAWVDERSGNTSLQKHLQELRDVVISPPQDREACENWLAAHKGGLVESLERFIQHKGNTKIRALMEEEGGVPSFLLTEIKTIFKDSAGHHKNIRNRLFRSLDAWRDPNSPPINREAIADVVDDELSVGKTIKKAQKMIDEGHSAFELDAWYRDKENRNSYWGSNGEMLARASEIFFAEGGNPVLGVSKDNQRSYPFGKELMACKKAFEQFSVVLSSEFNKDTVTCAQIDANLMKDRVFALRSKKQPDHHGARATMN